MGDFFVPTEEQETVINYGRNDKDMTIYTTDSTVITKLDKCVAAGLYEVIELHKVKGHVVGKTYRASKNLITFRTKKVVLTEEQKQARAETMRRVLSGLRQ